MMKNIMILMLLSIPSIGLSMIPREEFKPKGGELLEPSMLETAAIIKANNPEAFRKVSPVFIIDNFHLMMIMARQARAWKVAKYLLDEYASKNPQLLTRRVMKDPLYEAS